MESAVGAPELQSLHEGRVHHTADEPVTEQPGLRVALAPLDIAYCEIETSTNFTQYLTRISFSICPVN